MLKYHKKFLLKGNPPHNWPWKQNGTTFCGYHNDSRSSGQLKKRVTDKYFEKKLDVEAESQAFSGEACNWTCMHPHMCKNV